jgi:pimeloyl-ACP methyl ester carboxylesterase
MSIGPSPTKLLVIVPATGHDSSQWQSFFERFTREERSREYDWLLFDHGIQMTSLGSAREVANAVASCISEKFKLRKYESVTLIGHSIGGMLIRRAYLQSAGALVDQRAATSSWATQVDKILLFASVNKGVPRDKPWWNPIVNWLLRMLPHPRFILEDMALGSDFIADIRIAWIRHFGVLQDQLTEQPPLADRPRVSVPRIVQFWGTADSVVAEHDNADLEAFSGPVIERISGAKHGDLHRLEPEFAAHPDARWEIFRSHIFDRPQAAPPPPRYQPRRVLFIARGIRDSSNSDWVSDLRERAVRLYGEGNVEDIEYGYFSAAHFALRPIRSRNIPTFRDVYAQRLAENPLTEFDFIGHSNGTYILGHSLLSTPSIQFRHVALAAPVLPTDFDWNRLFLYQQVKAVRYDAATDDWPVGILCPILRALGFTDVGPSGVVLFGEGTMQSSRVQKVGWYDGDHSAALRVDRDRGIDNRQHLLNFAYLGNDLRASEPLLPELGRMQNLSRATPYVVWALIVLAALVARRLYRRGKRISFRTVGVALLVLLVAYAALDVI